MQTHLRPLFILITIQVNIDWAGIILERITGQHLGDYFREHIFAPLGIDTNGATMFPPSSAQSNLASIHQRDPTSGEITEREHLYGASLKQDNAEKQDAFFQSGGAGLFAKPREYVKILAAILNEGTSPTTGKQILKPETVELLWENQIPDQYVTSCFRSRFPNRSQLLSLIDILSPTLITPNIF